MADDGLYCLSDESGRELLPGGVTDRVDPELFRTLALAAVRAGFSDLSIQTEAQPRGQLDGRWYRLDRRPWTADEVGRVLCEIYDSESAVAQVSGREILDFGWEVRVSRSGTQRWRGNATAVLPVRGGGQGIEIALRSLPTTTPTLKEVALPDAIEDMLCPADGIIVVAGATGQGKSTTLAAVTRWHLERPEGAKVIDIQKPIEFTYRDVMRRLEGSPSALGQSEVGRHIHSFAAGVWSALRRAPDVIVIGEVRDSETIRAALEASLTGHLVYTTTHAGTVAETFRRLVTVFGSEDRESLSYDLALSLRCVVVQRLVPSARGGRLPVRDILVILPELRQKILDSPVSDWPGLVESWVNRKGEGVIRRISDDLRLLEGKGYVGAETVRRYAPVSVMNGRAA